NFVSVNGAFGLQVSTIGSDTYLAAGMEGNVTLSAGPSVSLNLTGLTIGALIDDNTTTHTTTYALQANEAKGSVTTLTVPSSPPAFSLSASNLSVLVDSGLDMSALPNGVPTSVSVPAITQTATESFTPDWTSVTSVTLQHAASAGTLTVTSTPSGGTAAT